METYIKHNRTEQQQIDATEIVQRIKNGEVELFREIIKKYNQRLYRTAIGFGIDNDDCDDLIQQTYIIAFEKMIQFEGKSSFITWLTRILINECLMFKRKNKRIREKLSRYSNNPDHTEQVKTPPLQMEEKETANFLESAILTLPEKYRVVYILREIEGQSTKEIAENLKISETNVKVRSHRAKKLMKNFLLENYKLSDIFPFGNERCDRIADSVMNYIYQKQRTKTN